MTPVQPLGDPEPVDLKFQYEVSDEWIDEEICRSGMEMPRDWATEFILTEVPGELRGRLLEAHRAYLQLPGFPTFFGPTDDPEDFLAGVEIWITQTAAEVDAEQKMTAAAKMLEEHQADSFDRERRDWIQEHGSRRLQIAEERGYKANRLYALERAANEFPFGWVDTSEEAGVRQRTDPSMEALELEEELSRWMAERGLAYGEPRIIWLVKPPKALEEMMDQEDYFFEQQEAVMVADFLGRYAIFLPVEADLRRKMQQTAEVAE